jgi:hypothetical protein
MSAHIIIFGSLGLCGILVAKKVLFLRFAKVQKKYPI